MAAPAADSQLQQRLQQLRKQFGSTYDSYAPATPDTPGSTRAKLSHHHRVPLQRAMVTDLDALYRDAFASSQVRMSAADLEALLRLVPSLTALSDFPTPDAPLLLIVVRAFQPRGSDAPTTRVSDAVLQSVLLDLTRLLHYPEPWSEGFAQVELAIRTTAAALLAPLLRYFVASAEEAAVEAQWRQWQELANHTLLDNVCTWITGLEAAQTQSGNADTQRKPSIRGTNTSTLALSPTTTAALLCQMLSFVVALVEHPCARSLTTESWTSLLSSVVSVMGQPRDATKKPELAYMALHVVLGVLDAGVVPPGVCRELALQTVAKSVPHGEADVPAPLPVSSLSSNTLNYASLFVAYVRLVKAVLLLEVEESPTGSDTARDTATQLHAVLAGLVEMSTHVYLEKVASPAAESDAAEVRMSLLSTVVKDLLSVRKESRSSSLQYTRYVQGMLLGHTPVVPYIITQLLQDCQAQMGLLTTSRELTALSTNTEVLQGVFLWSIHAAMDEGLLDVSHRDEVFTALPWGLYDAVDAVVGELTVCLAEVLLTHPAVCAHKNVAVLVARVISCEGLALLLRFLFFVMIPYGVADNVSWNARYRECLYAAEERVMRTVAAFDSGSPQLLAAFTDALDEMHTVLGPTVAKVSALLPSSTQSSLAPAGCQGALDKLMEVIPIF
ncbi:hypothetical protein LPMP_110480 [Leishmania panamensis]|uniref:Uncharacterized protein n=2 Tax=Leishmania guyanensis species complex TaxID=38579 RepID=A0A088RM24_LEIPA|nr:hypothetical protein LPMP_110480 [Leishmania panamensis]AIN96244.1 hypothetical protein LPMP_110480 [Leishmania panamensis]